MMQPKRTKFRKQMKGTNRGMTFNGNKVSFGEYGLKSTEHGRITARQIEAARRVITRYVKRGGKLWIRIFPTCRSPRSRSKFAWARAKATSSIGSPRSSPARCFMKLKASPKPRRRKRSVLLRPSCR